MCVCVSSALEEGVLHLRLCSECPNRHLAPVWQLRWTLQEVSLTGEEEVESLFSVAADGRISKWFISSSGLDCIGTALHSPVRGWRQESGLEQEAQRQ